jgi:hypothetical protein
MAGDGFRLWRDRAGLVHFAVPLILGKHALGALVAGQVFDQYPDQLAVEHVAGQLGLARQDVWQLARLEHPVKSATVRVYADLLATLADHTLRFAPTAGILLTVLQAGLSLSAWPVAGPHNRPSVVPSRHPTLLLFQTARHWSKQANRSMIRPFDIQLTSADRKKLLHAYRTAKDYLQRVRVHALLVLDDGYSVDEVKAVAFADESEVAKAVRWFRDGGVAEVIQEG